MHAVTQLFYGVSIVSIIEGMHKFLCTYRQTYFVKLLHSYLPVPPSSLHSASLRHIGVLFDTDLSLAAHVNQLTARCYSSLRRIKSCRRALIRSAQSSWLTVSLFQS